MGKKGYVGIYLHAHIPYVVSHGSWPHGMEWLNEAASECYVPLLDMLTRLAEEGIKPGITIGITPVLAEQLASEEFKESFVNYLNMKMKFARDNEKEFKETGYFHRAELASMWFDFYNGLLKKFISDCSRDIVWSFSRLQEEGYIEIATSCATHGYLPLLKRDESVKAQIDIGIDVYEKHFSRCPRGFWLPECAYRPSYRWKPPLGDGKEYERKGVEEFLSENGIDYFFVDSHLIRGGKAIGTYVARFEGLKLLWQNFEKEYLAEEEQKEKPLYKPYFVVSPGKDAGCCVFARDPVTALQVWSGEWGYPGDFRYLEFHKKHFPGGLRYWRVTGAKVSLAQKLEYEPDKAREAVVEHARHFVDIVKKTLNSYYDKYSTFGILSAVYDAELFGHWWFEGVLWLEEVIRLINSDDEIELITFGEYLDMESPSEVINLPEGSWGEGGFHYIWFNDMTQWSWERIYECEDLYVDVVKKAYDAGVKMGSLGYDILSQMAKELLLLQSSDWQFLISTFTAKDYAENRIVLHYENFKRLYNMFNAWMNKKSLSEPDIRFLNKLRETTVIFEYLDPFIWLKK